MSLVLDTGTMKYRENPNQPWRPLVIKANMNWESMADTYDPDNGTYEIGQYVLEDGVMYRCIYAIDIPEIWTPAHWTEINIGDELFSLQDSIASEAATRASEDTLIRNTLTQLDEGLAIHKTGDTADAAIAYGTFIHLTGNSSPSLPDGIYQVTQPGGISSGASYSSSNLTRQAASSGSLNTINNHIEMGSWTSPTAGINYRKSNRFVELSIVKDFSPTISIPAWSNSNALGTITGYSNDTLARIPAIALKPDYSLALTTLQISSSGVIDIMNNSGSQLDVDNITTYAVIHSNT